MSPRICTSCSIPHITHDWYLIEFAHPRRGECECVEAHERRIPAEVRDYGTGKPPAPPAPIKPMGRPKYKPDLLELICRS